MSDGMSEMAREQLAEGSRPLYQQGTSDQRALDKQEGGNHYKDLKIQPVEYIHANGLDYFAGNVVKYITRWRVKNGVEDLLKARHYIDLLIELENGPKHTGDCEE
jgi:hypothetical protein